MCSPFEIRADWAFDVATASQHLIGSLTTVDAVAFRQAFVDLSTAVPKYVSPAERAFLNDRVTALAIRAAHYFDGQFHRSFGFEPCDGRSLTRALSVLSAGGSDPLQAARVWSESFLADFQVQHTWPLGQRLRQYVDEHYTEQLELRRLSKHFGCSRSALARAFVATTGGTLHQYQTAVRVRSAVRLLREEELKVEAVALHVGYRSPKNFYRVLRKCTGLSPSDVRRLDGCHAEGIVPRA